MNRTYIDNFIESLPEQWDVEQLHKLLNKFDSGDWGKTPENDNIGNIVIRSTDFDELGRIVFDKAVRRIIDKKIISKKYLIEGDILLNKSSGSDKHIGKVIYFDINMDEKYHFSNFIQRMRVNNNILVDKYLYYYLDSIYEQLLLTKYVQTSSGLKNIDLKGYSKQRLPVPPLAEQRGIVEVLGTADECIRLTDEVIGRAEELKRGLMQRLLTRGIGHTEYKQTPLGEIPKTWKIVNLKQLITDSKYGSSEKNSDDEIGFPILRIPNVIGGKIDLNDLKYVDLEFDDAKKYFLEEGDLLIVRTNANPDYIGRSASYENFEGKWVFASYLIRLKINKNINNYNYVKYFLNNYEGRKQIRRIARTSAGNYNLNVPNLKSIKISLPPLSEQDKIVEIINNCEVKIEEEQKIKNFYINIKKGLMQALLSGKVRVELRGNGLHRIRDS